MKSLTDSAASPERGCAIPVTLRGDVAAVVNPAPRPIAEHHAVVFECRHPVDGEAICPQDARHVAQMRRVGRVSLRQWGLWQVVDDALLIISELVTNAIENGEGTSVGFSISYSGATVRIEVADGSHDRPCVRSQSGTYEERGRGLLLVESIASAWGTSEDGTRTWCELQVAEDRQGEPT
ncbi:ATP-binding protein [Streptomyces sp. NPDC049906]|uniref:ATP-binding protein n=1 Tax=Streptomyces sp. NPDC049906 TaxID=3155656 RepID=UPI003421A0F8